MIPLLALAALAPSLATTPVRADSTTVLASYDAPEACPPRHAFVAAVAARGAQFDEADAAGKSDPRQVAAASCTEVVDALAVVSALALRPDDVASGVASVAPVPKVDNPAAGAPIVAQGPHRLRGHTEYGSRVLEVTAGKLRLDRENRITLSAGVMYGLIRSHALPRYDATFSTARFMTTPSGEQHLVGYIPHIRITGLGPYTNSSNVASASTFGLAAAVGGCASPLYDTGGFIVLICGDLGVGIMSLETKTSGRSKQQSQPFWTAEIEAEAQYNVGPWFFVSLKVGVGFASRFFVPDDTGIRLHLPLTGNAMLGLGVHF
jgi:hypothetical protein